MPAWRSAVTAIALVIGCPSAHAQTFSRVVTAPDLGRFDYVLAVADLDGDGRDDVVVGGLDEYKRDASAEERLTMTTLRLFAGAADGGFRHAPALVEGTIDARDPIVLAADLNGDGRPDLAVFDHGVYVGEESLGYGNPPQLLLSGPGGFGPRTRWRMPSDGSTSCGRISVIPGPPTSMSSRRPQAISTATVTSICGWRARAAPTSPATSW